METRNLSHLEATLAGLATEARDPALADIDRLSIAQRCRVQNEIDRDAVAAVAGRIDEIACAVERIAGSLRSGGRLIYVGAGTSGRLGVLDASECPPTFGSDPSQVQAIIAGGDIALRRAVEGAEDDFDLGAAQMAELAPTALDCVAGISASGRTPFVAGALNHARAAGAYVIAVVNNDPSELASIADVAIAAVVGPEFVAGSTRLKAGTAQKLMLNMLTTQAMIEIGKTYGNAMVDVMVTNSKLAARATRLVREIAGVNANAADRALQDANGSVKRAILMLKRGVDVQTADAMLASAAGRLRVAIESA